MGCPARKKHIHWEDAADRSTLSANYVACLIRNWILLTMMLFCFLAYMLYTIAWRFTTSRASLASLMKPDASASSLCARKSCFVLLSTYLQVPRCQGAALLESRLKHLRGCLEASEKWHEDCLLSNIVIWELGACTMISSLSRSVPQHLHMLE